MEEAALPPITPAVCALCPLAEIVGNPELDRSSRGTMMMVLNMARYKAAAKGTGRTDWILFPFPKIKQNKQTQFLPGKKS